MDFSYAFYYWVTSAIEEWLSWVIWNWSNRGLLWNIALFLCPFQIRLLATVQLHLNRVVLVQLTFLWMRCSKLLKCAVTWWYRISDASFCHKLRIWFKIVCVWLSWTRLQAFVVGFFFPTFLSCGLSSFLIIGYSRNRHVRTSKVFPLKEMVSSVIMNSVFSKFGFLQHSFVAMWMWRVVYNNWWSCWGFSEDKVLCLINRT